MSDFPVLFSDDEFEKIVSKSIPKSSQDYLSDPEQLIESMAAISKGFPHILSKIELLWGSDELDAWLNKLITETHRSNGDQRRGFPPDIMNHLLKIYNIHFRSLGKPIPILTDWKSR